MAVLGNVSGVPVFSTIQEALAYARANRLSGYHTHRINGVLGYMGGSSHNIATGRRRSNISAGPNGGYQSSGSISSGY